MVVNVQSDCVASFWQAVYAVKIHFLAGSIQVFKCSFIGRQCTEFANINFLAGVVQSVQMFISWQAMFVFGRQFTQ